METIERPEVADNLTEQPVPLHRRAFVKVASALAAVAAFLYVQAGTASAQVPTALSDGITDIETNMLLLPALLIGSAVAIGVGFMFVRVTPRVIRWLSNRFG